jgi:hypothetical protein
MTLGQIPAGVKRILWNQIGLMKIAFQNQSQRDPAWCPGRDCRCCNARNNGGRRFEVLMGMSIVIRLRFALSNDNQAA